MREHSVEPGRWTKSSAGFLPSLEQSDLESDKVLVPKEGMPARSIIDILAKAFGIIRSPGFAAVLATLHRRVDDTMETLVSLWR